MISTNCDSPVILVTGFGPFGSHLVNSSQKVVEILPSLDIESKLGVKLHTQVLDVGYDHVLENVPGYWKKFKPQLVIHIGVSELAKEIILEEQAFNCEYIQPDVRCCVPTSKECIPGFPSCVKTELDLNKALKDAEAQIPSPLKVSLSSNPGRFLCGFAYYLSLNICRDRSLFIHVPTLQCVDEDPEVGALRLAQSVAILIQCLYAQVKEKPPTEIDQVERIQDCVKLQEVSAIP